MFDGIVVLNEIMGGAKRFKKKCPLVKVDFQKGL